MTHLFAWFARNPLIIALVSLVVLGALWWTSCRPKPTPIPPKEQSSTDSLRITQRGFQAQRDTLIVRETTFVRQSAINRAGAITSTHAADSLHALANAAQRVAEAERDTSSRWHDVAILRGLENDSLRSANGGLLAALDNQTQARTAADARSSADSSRLAAVQNLNDRLAADLRRADPPCRVLYIARCPSRRVVALASIPLGFAAKVTYDRLTKRKS